MYCIGPSSTDQIKQEVQSLSDQVFSKKKLQKHVLTSGCTNVIDLFVYLGSIRYPVKTRTCPTTQ